MMFQEILGLTWLTFLMTLQMTVTKVLHRYRVMSSVIAKLGL